MTKDDLDLMFGQNWIEQLQDVRKRYIKMLRRKYYFLTR